MIAFARFAGAAMEGPPAGDQPRNGREHDVSDKLYRPLAGTICVEP